MKRWTQCAVLTGSVLALGAIAAAADKPANAEAEAQKTAESWLALVDSGKSAESWEQSSAMFRGAITKDAWASAIAGVRGPLGKLKSRHLESAQYMTSLPGAPDGEYVVLQYKAVFENKAAAVETITPMREQDGAWRVSGYYIR